MRAVGPSTDLDRIVALPRRALTTDEGDVLSQHLRGPRAKPGQKLFAIQASALCDLHDHLEDGGNGLLLPVGVGGGKSLICVLAGAVVPTRDVKRLVWMVPANLVAQASSIVNKARLEWKITYDIRIVSYETLSSPKNGDILDRLMPDVIACDEAHRLRGKSVRTKRFKRHIVGRAEADDAPIVLFLSGTLTKRSLRDFAWMSYYTHPNTCPVPKHYPTLEEWDAAIGVASWGFSEPMSAGALKVFCDPKDPEDTPRKAYRRRLTDTLGIVGTKESQCDSSLYIHTYGDKTITVPTEITSALKTLRAKKETPFGETFEDGLTQARYARQMAMGYWTRWVWPNGRPDILWLEARAAWFAELRALVEKGKQGCDSPLLVTQAVAAGKIPSGYYADWCVARQRWPKGPPVETVWISDYAVEHAKAWARDTAGGIIWYAGIPFGNKLREAGIEVYMAGDDQRLVARAESALERATKSGVPESTVIACSIAAHGTGKNLQAWNRNLFASCPSSGAIWEQTVARTHRPGAADEVYVDVHLHTQEVRAAWEQALRDAQYLHEMQGAQKLILATREEVP